METSPLRRLASWVFPEGVLLAAAVVVTRLEQFRQPVAGFTDFYAGAVLVVGLAIGLRFHRSRLLFALLLLALTDRFLPHLPRIDSAGERAILQAIGILLPLNLAAFSLLPERGLFTLSGLIRLIAILGQAVAVAAFASAAPEVMARVLERPIVFEWPWLATWTPLGHAALVAVALAAAQLIAGLFFESGAAGRPMLFTLAAAFIALHVDPAGPLSTFFLATGGLILVTGVVETSYRLAYRDGLTGLPARRALNEALERLEGDYVVAMADVDHFKAVNDTYGHDVGDQVLKMVAARLASVADGGRAFRYGGEEFAVLFPGRTTEAVLPELERLREIVAASGFAVRSRSRLRRKPRASKVRVSRSVRAHLTVTISIGVADRSARRSTPDDVLQAADRALYKAKEGGRNQTCPA